MSCPGSFRASFPAWDAERNNRSSGLFCSATAITNSLKMRGKSMTLIRAVALVLCLGAVAACDTNEGPVERAGERVDDAGQALKDTVDPPGPAERIGRSIDRVTQ